VPRLMKEFSLSRKTLFRAFFPREISAFWSR